MSDYEIKNSKLSGSISSIKASLFDVTSELNVKILSLNESTNEEDIKLKKALIDRLSNIMKLSNSINDEIISIDKNLDGNLEVSKDNNSIEETEEDDNTVVISDKAIDDMMNVENEDDVTEVNIGTEEVKEEAPAEENKPVQQEDRGDAVVLDLNAYEKLKGKNLSSDDSPETEAREEDTSVEGSGEKLFDLDNVGEVELNEEMKTTETSDTTISPVNIAELDQADAISLKLTDYEKLKGKKLDNDDSEKKEETSEENESVEEEPVVTEEKKEVVEETPVEENTDTDTTEEASEEDDEEEAEVTEDTVEEDDVEDDSDEEESEEEEEVSEEEVEETPVTEETPVVEENTEETKVEETPEVKEEPVVEEKPQLSDAEKSIEQQKEAVTNKKISYIINKDTIDPAKAILVTSLQFEKLLLSRDEQKTLCKLRKFMVMPGEREESVDLEAMLQQAEELYKKGDTAAAEELYNKISELNKN